MPRWLWVAIGTTSITCSICSGAEALRGQPFAREAGDHLLRAGAGGHALGLDPGQGAGAALGGDRGAEEDVDLLRAPAALGSGDRLRVVGGDGDLGPQPALALAHLLGDVGGQHLGLEGLAQHHLVDRLADDLLEAGHVDAGLLRVEVDEALELGVEEVLRPVGLDPDHLLDPGHPDPREADLGRGRGGLDVRSGGGGGGRLAGHRLMKSKRPRSSASPRATEKFFRLYFGAAGASGPAPWEWGESQRREQSSNRWRRGPM